MVHKATDMDAVARIINHPEVFGWITDDLSPEVYEPNPQALYIINEEATGVIRVDPFNGVTCQVHTSAMPQLWGNTRKFVKDAIAWGWENTRYSKIISLVPDFNPAAAMLCKRCGFQQEGTIKKSFLKNFKLYDQALYGLSKYAKKS